MSRPPLPPFTLDTAVQQRRLAEDAWSGRDPARVASINDLPITESERLYHWPAGRRPNDPGSLTALGQ